MAIVKIPFNIKPYSKNDYPDKYTTDNAYNDELLNGLYFPDGSVRFRPGYTQFVDLGISDRKIDGNYFSVRIGTLFSVCNGNLYNININGVATLLGSDVFIKGTPVYFEDQGTNVYAVNGGNIVYFDDTTVTNVTDADAPVAPTNIAFIDGYLLFDVPSNPTRVQFSDLLAPTAYSALNFFSAEGKPDAIKAIRSKDRQLYVFGTETVEVWYNDGDTPFSRRSDIFLEFGVLAKHSVVLMRNSFFMWLDNRRNIIILGGVTPKVVSDPIKHILTNLSQTSLTGAIATEFYMNSTALYKIDFPADGRTFVYDYEKDVWSEWGIYNIGTNSYSMFRGQSFVSIPTWGFDLIGDSQDSIIYKISFNYLTDNGTKIRFLRRTPIIDHGTTSLKRSNSINLKLRRGNGYTNSNFNILDTDAEPFIMIRWRDDNMVGYGNWKHFSLGKDGIENQVILIKPMGIYRTRQYEISCSDPFPFILYDMEEDVEILK